MAVELLRVCVVKHKREAFGMVEAETKLCCDAKKMPLDSR
jgi:hypothetical protein